MTAGIETGKRELSQEISTWTDWNLTRDFGENAAWWWIMVLAFNLNAALKSLVLGGQWVYKRMKAIRFHLINIPARVMERSRQLSLPLSAEEPA